VLCGRPEELRLWDEFRGRKEAGSADEGKNGGTGRRQGLSFEGRNEGLSLLLGELLADGVEEPVEFRTLEGNALFEAAYAEGAVEDHRRHGPHDIEEFLFYFLQQRVIESAERRNNNLFELLFTGLLTEVITPPSISP
jgi:hypothetical protein